MCRAPVTLGGGMTMQKGLRLGSGRLWKKPCSSQYWSQRSWASCGSYCFGSSIAVASFIIFKQLVLQGVGQGPPTGFDDVFAHADCAPNGVTVAPLDDDAYFCSCLGPSVDDPHLVIHQVQVCQSRVARLKGLAK